MHEFIHAFGFHHEHVRPDRDNYVEIQWNSIKNDEQIRSNYEIWHGSKTYGVAYDGLSVMHYTAKAQGFANPATPEADLIVSRVHAWLINCTMVDY